MSECNNQGESPIDGLQLFGNRGDGLATTWLTDTMRTIANVSTCFQETFIRLMEADSVASPPFCQMMQDEVKATETRTPSVAAGGNRRRAVTVMTPEETAAARSLLEF